MTNFKIPKNGNNMMPFNFGPKDNDPRNSGWYRDVSMLIIPIKQMQMSKKPNTRTVLKFLMKPTCFCKLCV